MIVALTIIKIDLFGLGAMNYQHLFKILLPFYKKIVT